LIYRSATLNYASKADIERILNECKSSLLFTLVISILDLRSKYETRQPCALVDEHYNEAPAVGNQVYRIDLASQLRDAIFKSLSYWTCLVYLLFKLMGWRAYAQRYVVKNSFLGQEGLFGLNKGFIHYSTAGIKKAFDVLSVRESYPVIIHCSAGKDRTGFIIALIQLLAGVRRDVKASDLDNRR
jgi:Tyrosine phosphatase family